MSVSCKPPITNLYFSPIFTGSAESSRVSVTSSIFVISFVIFASGICVSASNSFTIIPSFLFITVDASKYLSITENSTVSVLFV